DVGRGHQPIGILVMLVHADAVEAKFIGIRQGVDVLAIKLLALDRIVERVGKPDPGRIVLLVEVVGKIGPGHQVKEKVLHGGSLLLHGSPSRPVGQYRLPGYHQRDGSASSWLPAMACRSGTTARKNHSMN